MDKKTAAIILAAITALASLIGYTVMPSQAPQPVVTSPAPPAPPQPGVIVVPPETPAPPLAVPSVLPTGVSLLKSTDLQYAGSFKMPTSVDGWSYGGLALRKKADGTKSLIFAGRAGRTGDMGQTTFEISIAAPSLDQGAAPRAALLNKWPDIWQGHRIIPGWTGPGNGQGYLQTEGFGFNSLLYGQYGLYYDVAPGIRPCIVAAQLNDDGTVAAAAGPWQADVNQHAVRQWSMRIPDWFASAYTGGATWGVGSGIDAGSGTSSYGPDLFAATLPTLNTPTTQTITTQRLCFYPSNPYTLRLVRSPDYNPVTPNATLFPAPANGVGYWTGVDFIGAATWIDLPDKTGVLYCARFGLDSVWYGNSPLTLADGTTITDAAGAGHGVHASRYGMRWLIYDPSSFAAVAKGAAQPGQIQPAETWDPMPTPAIALSKDYLQTGVVCDPETRTLYLICPKAENAGSATVPLPLPVIHVWKIQ